MALDLSMMMKVEVVTWSSLFRQLKDWSMLLVAKMMATKSCFYFHFKESVAKCHVDYELNERTKLISVY